MSFHDEKLDSPRIAAYRERLRHILSRHEPSAKDLEMIGAAWDRAVDIDPETQLPRVIDEAIELVTPYRE